MEHRPEPGADPQPASTLNTRETKCDVYATATVCHLLPEQTGEKTLIITR